MLTNTSENEVEWLIKPSFQSKINLQLKLFIDRCTVRPKTHLHDYHFVVFGCIYNYEVSTVNYDQDVAIFFITSRWIVLCI